MRSLLGRPFWIAAGLALLAVLAATDYASATHVRPKGATPWRVPLVPAYKACTSTNSVREVTGPGTCVPPTFASNYLTVGTADANGAPTKSIASGTFTVKATSPEDVMIDYDITDVRCLPGTTGCGSANSADGPDYTGSLGAYATNRVTDHRSTGGVAGTTQETGGYLGWAPNGLPVTIPCQETADVTVGSTCTISTSINALRSSAISDGSRMIIQKTSSLQVTDGGADNDPGTLSDNTLFMEEGIFVP
jgi:hypothetical protein